MYIRSTEPNTNSVNQAINEADKDEAWYKQNVRYFSKFYNSQYASYGDLDTSTNPIHDILRFYKYYLGKQDNVNYNHVTQDPSGNTLPAVWIKGQKISSLIDYMHGVLGESIEKIEVDAIASSKDAVNRRDEKKNMLLTEFDLQEVLPELAELHGINFTANEDPDLSFESYEDIERYIAQTWKEKGEIIARELATDILIRNKYVEKYQKAGMTAFITGMCGVHPYVQNGRVYQELVPTYNLIWDNSVDDDFNRQAKFVGKIKRMTVSDVISRWQKDLTEAEIKELRELEKADSKTLDACNEGQGNFNWWIPGTSNSKNEVTVVTMFWISLKDLRYEKKVDPYGKVHYSKVRKKSKQGDYWTTTVKKATLIGNKYLVEWGDCDNIVRDKENPSDSVLPIKVFIPNMFLGTNKSIVSRLADHQDSIDRINHKIQELIGKDLGKCYVFNANKTGDVTPREILTDLKQMGITVLNQATGEDDDALDRMKAVEVIDMTADPNIRLYIELRREEERIMEEIVNIPKVALGQQQTYIGLGTQQNTISQSSRGTAYWFKGFMNFILETLQYSTELFKTSRQCVESEDAIQIVGDSGIKYLTLTKDYLFEDYKIKIKFRDAIDEQGKQRILSYGQAWSQNPAFGIDPIDILKLEQAKSFTDAISDLEYSMKKKKKEQMRQQQMQMQQQAMMQEQQMAMQGANQMDVEGMRQQGLDQRTEQQLQAKLLGEMIKQDGGEQGMPPM